MEEQRKRALIEKRRKVLSLDDASTEREKLIRMGVITPFENIEGEEQPTTASIPKIPKVKRKAPSASESTESSSKKRKKLKESIEEAPSEPWKQSSSSEDTDVDKDYNVEFEDRDEFIYEEEDYEDEKEIEGKRKKIDKRGRKKVPRVDVKSDEEIYDDGAEAQYIQRLKAFLDSREVTYTDSDDLVELTRNYTSAHEEVAITQEFKMPKNMYDQLFDYQKTGVRWMWELHKQGAGGIIGDEMGLGKTIQVVAFLSTLDHLGLYKPSLIVTPATVMSQWVREFHDWWPAFRVTIMHSSGTATQDKKEALVANIINDKRKNIR